MKCEMQESDGGLSGYVQRMQIHQDQYIHLHEDLPDARSVTSHSSIPSHPSFGSAGGLQHRADGHRAVLSF